MTALFGEYPVRADAKGRFLLPAALQRQLAGLSTSSSESFVLARGLDPCLVLFSEAVWQTELTRLYGHNRFDAEARTFARLFQSGAQPLSLDAQNRLLVPKPLWDELMATAPSLSPELILIGAWDRIELWAEARYRQWLAEQQPRLAELAQRHATLPTAP
jgi:MraZ protein